jgi:hypothetical protein
MPEEIEITVENKLITEKRDLNVYHHSTQSAHIISHNSSITLPLGTNGDNDYLHISVVKGPGYLEKNCLINVPSWADFEFTSKESVTAISITHSHDPDGARTVLKIPPGPPAWELKITRSTSLDGNGQFTKKKDHVIISDG